jgi:hypothetical protein
MGEQDLCEKGAENHERYNLASVTCKRKILRDEEDQSYRMHALLP